MIARLQATVLRCQQAVHQVQENAQLKVFKLELQIQQQTQLMDKLKAENARLQVLLRQSSPSSDPSSLRHKDDDDYYYYSPTPLSPESNNSKQHKRNKPPSMAQSILQRSARQLLFGQYLTPTSPHSPSGALTDVSSSSSEGTLSL